MKTIQQKVIDGDINPYDLLDLWNEPPLSKEDIESLGFKCYDSSENNILCDFTFKNYILSATLLSTKNCRITIIEQKHQTIEVGDIYIKNKSELRRLLTQLRIEK